MRDVSPHKMICEQRKVIAALLFDSDQFAFGKLAFYSAQMARLVDADAHCG
jgi:hypothetical protein